MRHLLLVSALLFGGACTGDTVDSGVENAAPEVAITQPLDGDSWAEGESVSLRAVVSDDWTRVSELAVSWTVDDLGPLEGSSMVNGNTIGLDVTTVIPGGEHTLRLQVSDQDGAQTEAAIYFSVLSQEPPTVSLLDPEAEGIYGEGDRVPVEASFYDPDEESVADLVVSWGGVAEGHPGASLNPDKSGRISFELENLEVGNHTLSVEVADSAGSTASASLWFEVIGWDADGDGYDSIDLGGKDCDDEDDDIHPGVDELCNDRDDDCDGRVDEDPPEDGLLYFGDNDEDGYGSPLYPLRACTATTGYVDNDGDCDDTDPEVHPGVTEVCDGIDNDCNGILDSSEAVDAATLYLDVDSDGYGGTGGTKLGCDEEPFYAFESGDCDDANPEVNPGVTEVCDGIDNDCSGDSDGGDAADASTWYEDADEDAYGAPSTATNACEQPDGWTLTAEDCDDGDDEVNPDATEVCDSVDNNCDGDIDEDTAEDALTWFMDMDGDGHGDPDNTTLACEQPSNATGDGSDCDDTDFTISPSATEYCDGEDDDCDGTVDEDGSADTSIWYLDDDADGYGNTEMTTEACYEPTGYVSLSGDCDDEDSSLNPAATEYCDEIDNDCDGVTDPDSSADVIDWYTDGDGDGYADPSSSVVDTSCYGGSGMAEDPTDCDDADDEVHPNADEQCNSEDDDCDSSIDEDPADGDYYTIDADGDGFGELDEWYWGCDGVDNDLDCDDGDPTEPHRVDGSSGTTSPSGTEDDPWLYIQDAIDNAGSCVAVFPGTYNESLDFNGRDLHVRSVYGPGLTTIDASGTGDSVVTFDNAESEDALLEGFTLTGGAGHLDESYVTWDCSSQTTTGDICSDFFMTYCGGGVYVREASPTLVDLVVEDNHLSEAGTTQQITTGLNGDRSGGETFYSYSFGGGICLMGSNSELEQVHVHSNYADQGGGGYIDENSDVTWSGSWVAGNTAEDGAGLMVDGGVLTGQNLLVVGNEGTDYGGALLVSEGSVDLINVTLGLNTAGSVSGVYVEGTSDLDLASVILYGSGSGTGIQMDSSGTLFQTYSDVYGFSTNFSGVTDPTDSNGNLNQEPVFRDVSDDGDPDNDDWELDSSSPCLDAGNPDSAFDDVDGSPNDMGSYGGPEGDWDE